MSSFWQHIFFVPEQHLALCLKTSKYSCICLYFVAAVSLSTHTQHEVKTEKREEVRKNVSSLLLCNRSICWSHEDRSHRV